MSYYQGDFYQGDPGFLSGFGRILGGVASFIPGVGGIASRVIKGVAGSKAGKMVAQHPTLSAAGASGLIGAGGGELLGRMGGPIQARGMGVMGPGGVSARGYHMSKPRKVNPKSGIPHLVRNRRMRVTNPRALRRAIRRARGFERLARKVMHFVSPRHVKGRAVFKARRRR